MKAEMFYAEPLFQLPDAQGLKIMKNIVNIPPQTYFVLNDKTYYGRENNSKSYDLLFSIVFCFSLSFLLAACFC